MRKFASYNVLDRVPMFMGIPFGIWLLLLLITMFLFLVGQIFFGFMALLLPIVFVLPIALFLKQLCSTDDRAMRVFGLELKFRKQRKFYKEFNNTLTFLPSKYLRNEKTLSENFR
ncbi:MULTISPECIES: VirB3 family type IV secretion system protein [Moraxella]|uniref:Type IV secretory pathway, VirB3-like protein n=2 Tax=Moraxella TaxID=475 RepID=A0ABX3NH77_9GAMM|nr:VirB3 family type IV secretion system protein [Moraxella equi]OPH37641.1 hypothetical protein B5J93_07935 [Moraxella equi]